MEQFYLNTRPQKVLESPKEHIERDIAAKLVKMTGLRPM